MKKTITFILICSIFLASSLLAAPEKNDNPNISFGAGGGFIINDAYTRRGDMDWSADYGFCAGLIFEKMFSNLLGIQSGVWFTQTDIMLKIPVGSFSIDSKISSRTISVPFYLIVSFNASFFSLNILSGFYFTQFIESKMQITELMTKTVDVLPDINYVQLGVSGGLNFKFRVSDFVDVFAGGLVDFYFTNLMSSPSNALVHLYSFRFISGVLFRTNIFPMQ